MRRGWFWKGGGSTHISGNRESGASKITRSEGQGSARIGRPTVLYTEVTVSTRFPPALGQPIAEIRYVPPGDKQHDECRVPMLCFPTVCGGVCVCSHHTVQADRGVRASREFGGVWFAVGGRTRTDRRQSTPLSGPDAWPDGVDVQFLSKERRGERNFLV